MIESIEELIAALREEMQQYGEMLARLDDQQELVMRRAAEAVMDSVPGIQAQSQVVSQIRETRYAAFKRLCSVLGVPESSTFKEVLPQLPERYRPLLRALIQENNDLLQRIQQRVRQNHILLSRTIESMQRVINALGIHSTTPVYNGSGDLFSPSATASGYYQAVC